VPLVCIPHGAFTVVTNQSTYTRRTEDSDDNNNDNNDNIDNTDNM